MSFQIQSVSYNFCYISKNISLSWICSFFYLSSLPAKYSYQLLIPYDGKLKIVPISNYYYIHAEAVEKHPRRLFKGTAIWGAMDQKARDEKLMHFRRKWVSFIFVTDLAARGLDIPLLENVVHYDFPSKLKLFIHRSGRTARNGQHGVSYCLIT